MELLAICPPWCLPANTAVKVKSGAFFMSEDYNAGSVNPPPVSAAGLRLKKPKIKATPPPRLPKEPGNPPNSKLIIILALIVLVLILAVVLVIVLKKDNTGESVADGRGTAAKVMTSGNVELEIDMIRIEGGQFQRGDTFGGGRTDEYPVISTDLQSYQIGKCEVTEEIYAAVMGIRPRTAGNLPAVNVSWLDCVTFCNALSSLQGLEPFYAGDLSSATGVRIVAGANGYRLPSEEEWEYAARGGNRSENYYYSGSNDPSEIAWYEGNSGGRTHPVGSRRANELGLYDMSGNVFEWVWDWGEESLVDREWGPTSGSYKVFRGGSAVYPENELRVSARIRHRPSRKTVDLGFRLARSGA